MNSFAYFVTMKKKQSIFEKFLLGCLVIFSISCSSDESSSSDNTIPETEDSEVSSPTTTPEEPNEPVDPSDPDPEEPSETTYGNITWINWNLSVPINRGDGSATTIEYEAIEANNFTSAEAEYIQENEDGSYKLFSEFTGYTTSGESGINEGKFCRTELREYYRGNQTTDDNWLMDEGTHILESTLKVVRCEGDEDCIVAQIHGKESTTAPGSPATIKIRWRSGEIVVDYYRALSGSTNTTQWTSDNDNKIDFGDVANEKFTVQLKVENGVFYFGLICEAKNIDTGYEEIYDYKSNGYSYDNYFKTGNYFIWNGDKTASSEVILYDVITDHK